jgi:hypothetical protein
MNVKLIFFSLSRKFDNFGSSVASIRNEDLTFGMNLNLFETDVDVLRRFYETLASTDDPK